MAKTIIFCWNAHMYKIVPYVDYFDIIMLRIDLVSVNYLTA